MTWVASVAAAIDATGLAQRAPRGDPLIFVCRGIGGADGVAVDAFPAQLDARTERGRVLPLGDALATLGRPESAEVAAITFHDGYRDFAEVGVHGPSHQRLRGLDAYDWTRYEEALGYRLRRLGPRPAPRKPRSAAA